MSLLEITKLPTAENSVIHLHPTDNSGVARVPLSCGSELKVDGVEVNVRGSVPAGHKVALQHIGPGEAIIRYGQVMGRARVPIEAGEHVHVHNVTFEELTFAYEFPTEEKPLQVSSK